MTCVFTLGVIITGIVLASRLGDFITVEKSRTVIELNNDSAKVFPQNDTDVDSVDDTKTSSSAPQQSSSDAKPGFEASDAQGVWEQEQQVEIFKVKYNESGNITVDGVKDKVIAPGTTNIYNFTFKNTGNVPLEYTLTTEVEFSNQEYTLPVSVRLFDQSERYLIGSATSFDDPQKLNIISDKAGLSPKSYVNYAFEWEWPFENGNDSYDTLLGNMAVDEELTMTVIINVKAEADVDASGGNPYTGDDSDITVNIIVFIISLIGIIAMIIIMNKKQKEGLSENE